MQYFFPGTHELIKRISRLHFDLNSSIVPRSTKLHWSFYFILPNPWAEHLYGRHALEFARYNCIQSPIEWKKLQLFTDGRTFTSIVLRTMVIQSSNTDDNINAKAIFFYEAAIFNTHHNLFIKKSVYPARASTKRAFISHVFSCV